MFDTLAAYRDGSTEPWTADLIAALVRATKPANLVETGTFRGLTTKALLDAMSTYAGEHGSVIRTIDNDADRCRRAADWLGSLPFAQGVGYEILCGDALAFLRELPEGSIDFLFLDDTHEASHVHQEVVAGLRALRPRGLMVLHDVIGPYGLDTVVKQYSGVCLDLPRLHVAGGLGLIAK